MSVVTASGREARTVWRVLERFPASGRAWLEVRPATGRTHQIRVHLASVGIPIEGDPVYGRRHARETTLERPALHAAVLGFSHPRNGERLRFESPVADDIDRLLTKSRLREGAA
jgi:23S rRNA pseudouridine1911/1915/1917 synthase